MSTEEIARALTSGRLDAWLKAVEGLRSEEIASLVEKQFSIQRDQFLETVKGKEGHLFPDSYLIPLGSSADKVAEIMTKNFDKKTELLWEEAKTKGLSKDEVIILASLVERETSKEEDRPLVAGILIKRLKNNWPLQIDATVQYAKATLNCSNNSENCEWWPKVYSGDIKAIKSDFNTYEHVGLPPSPICNPSLSSIRAVINYKDTPYWFYLSDSNGEIHFSETAAEHQKNIQRYL